MSKGINENVLEVAFNEEYVAKAAFNIADDYKPTINGLLKNKQAPILCRLVIKYLFNTCKIDPNNIKSYLSRYSVLLAYYYVSKYSAKNIKGEIEEFDVKERVIEFDDILNDRDAELSIDVLDSLKEKLKDSKLVFAQIFVGGFETANEAKKKLNEAYGFLPSSGSKYCECMWSILNMEYDFFNKNNKIEGLDWNSKKFDELICEVLNEDVKYKNFTFKMELQDAKELIGADTDKKALNSIIYLGYICNYIYNRPNRKLLEGEIISLPQDGYIRLCCRDKDASIVPIGFLDSKADLILNNNYKIINKERFKEFGFIYNSKRCRLSKLVDGYQIKLL